MEKIEKYDRVIDEVGQEYTKWFYDNAVPSVSGKPILNGEGILTRGEFINKCKTDSEFSKKWGLNIEERELTPKERMNLCEKYWKQHNLFPLLWRVDGGGFMYDEIEKTIDRTCWNIPKRIITTKYQNETIEIYE